MPIGGNVSRISLCDPVIKKRKNSITTLIINNTTVYDVSSIIKESMDFFRNIFLKEFQSRPSFRSLNFKLLNEEQCMCLTIPFSHEQIDHAVASCDSQKSAKSDGFNFHFIKSSWEFIKQDICETVQNFRTSPRLQEGCNSTYIALIDKIDHPQGLKDFLPVSMAGCVYKIISKLLACSLQRVMEHLIGLYQSSSIKGWQILEGA